MGHFTHQLSLHEAKDFMGLHEDNTNSLISLSMSHTEAKQNKKFPPAHVMNAYKGNWGIPPLILNPVLDWDKWSISLSIRLILGKEQVTNEWEAV